MAEDPSTGVDPSEDPGDPKDPNEDTGTEDTDGDPGQEKDPKDKPDPEKVRLIRARDTAKEKVRALQEKVTELEEKLNPGKADPVTVANRRLVAAEARVVLTGQGLKEAPDQRAVMDFLKLDDVSVGPDGEVDRDAIEEQVSTLLSIANKLAGMRVREKRGPRLDTRDLGGEKGKPADPAKARRLGMLRG